MLIVLNGPRKIGKYWEEKKKQVTYKIFFYFYLLVARLKKNSLNTI